MSIDSWNKHLEKVKRNVYKTPTPIIYGQEYCWIFGFTKLGKKVLWGPFLNDSEAELAAVELEGYEIFHLKTRNLTRATHEVKAELLKRGGDPDDALKQLLHKRE